MKNEIFAPAEIFSLNLNRGEFEILIALYLFDDEGDYSPSKIADMLGTTKDSVYSTVSLLKRLKVLERLGPSHIVLNPPSAWKLKKRRFVV